VPGGARRLSARRRQTTECPAAPARYVPGTPRAACPVRRGTGLSIPPWRSGVVPGGPVRDVGRSRP